MRLGKPMRLGLHGEGAGVDIGMSGLWEIARFRDTAARTNVTGNGTMYRIPANDTIASQSWASLNTSTGVVTVSEAGAYIIPFKASISYDFNQMDLMQWFVIVNGVAYTATQFDCNAKAFNSRQHFTMVTLGAGDTVDVRIRVYGVGSDSCDTVANASTFDIIKVSDLSNSIGELFRMTPAASIGLTNNDWTSMTNMTVQESAPFCTESSGTLTFTETGMYLVHGEVEINTSGAASAWRPLVGIVTTAAGGNDYSGAVHDDGMADAFPRFTKPMLIDSGETLSFRVYNSSTTGTLTVLDTSWASFFQVMRIA